MSIGFGLTEEEFEYLDDEEFEKAYDAMAKKYFTRLMEVLEEMGRQLTSYSEYINLAKEQKDRAVNARLEQKKAILMKVREEVLEEIHSIVQRTHEMDGEV